MLNLIVILPLISFLGCSLFGRKIGQEGSKALCTFILGTTFICSLFLFFDVVINKNIVFFILPDWFDLGLLYISYGFQADKIVACMLVLVTCVSSLVHLYSTSYMDGDPHLPRFLSYLSLFTFFMVVLVTGSNLIQLFIGWEGVGLCSYLLIGFWFTRVEANKAAIKAMVVNKVGDIGVLLGVSLLWITYGTLDFNSLALLSSLTLIPESTLSLCSFLLLIGVVGKSAQIGLHMWLPDAMEGPTPVSALIHAATMVTAGVFLIIRVSPLFEQTPSILILIVLLGSLTAFFSSTIGLVQSDLKKVIAYSTCSQLGYMVMICGFSQYNSGLFHLINHGFFKALLFLSAGSIIHAISNEQDLRRMGSLRFALPLSFICIIVGSMSLMALPFLTGFYSKDLILELVYGEFYLAFGLWLGLLAAFVTAFYSFRLIYYSFVEYNQSSPIVFIGSHEGNWRLITPLIVLFILSILGGFLLEFYLLDDLFPIMIPNFNKLLPFMISLSGAILAIFWGVLTHNSWHYFINKSFMRVYAFLSGAWYFDTMVKKIFIDPLLKMGFLVTYKLIDNQILEEFGPTKVSQTTFSIANSISKIHLGKISFYAFILVLFITFLFVQF